MTIRKMISIAIAICIALAFQPVLNSSVSYGSTKKPAKVKNLKVTYPRNSSCDSMVIKWKKAKHAKKYEIYIKTGKSKPSRFIEKGTKFEFYGTSGKYYKIKVRGINGKKKGKWSKTFKENKKKTPGDITGLTYVNNEWEEIVLSWNKSKHANGYLVEVRNSKKKLIFWQGGRISDPSSTVWLDDTFKKEFKDKKAYIRVRPYNDRTPGKWSKMIAAEFKYGYSPDDYSDEPEDDWDEPEDDDY